jgi:hypothetical protein
MALRVTSLGRLLRGADFDRALLDERDVTGYLYGRRSSSAGPRQPQDGRAAPRAQRDRKS